MEPKPKIYNTDRAYCDKLDGYDRNFDLESDYAVEVSPRGR
jgi:hypothetical protein